MGRMSVGYLKLGCDAVAGYGTTIVCVRDEDGGENPASRRPNRFKHRVATHGVSVRMKRAIEWYSLPKTWNDTADQI